MVFVLVLCLQDNISSGAKRGENNFSLAERWLQRLILGAAAPWKVIQKWNSRELALQRLTLDAVAPPADTEAKLPRVRTIPADHATESAHTSCRDGLAQPSETCVTPRLHTAERGRSMSVDTPERRWTRMQLHTKCASNCRAHPCASCRVPQAETCRGDYSSLLNAAAPVFKSHRFDSSGSALQRNLL